MEFELAPGRLIGPDHPVFIIAEIGQNHQGDLNIAKEMIVKAKACGADCVKFQKSCLEEKFTKNALKRPYNSENSFGSTYGKHKEFLEFSSTQYEELRDFSNEEVGIPLTASAMDPKSIDFLVELGVPFVKIGSGDVNNFFVLNKIAEMTGVNAVVSTGMANFDMVENIYNMFKKCRGNLNNFVIMQCTSSYPTESKDINLSVIGEYKKQFPDINIGYSGHEMGFIPTLGAVAIGAKVVERHFTLDKSLKGSDHKCSLNPEEFSEMVKSIRTMESALGNPRKKFLDSEKPCFSKLGKSVVAGQKLEKGTTIALEHLKIKVAEPHGWDANDVMSLVGKVLQTSVDEDDLITGELFGIPTLLHSPPPYWL